MREIQGIIPPTVTPFIKGTKKVDTGVVREHMEFLIDRGIHGVFVAGSTGEGLLFGIEEHGRLLETVVEQVRGRMIVIAHVGAIDTFTALELVNQAKQLGVDAVAAVAPFYYKYTDDCLMRYYLDISDACEDTRFFIYNNPFTTGHTVSPALARKIAELCPNFAGIKDSSEQIQHISQYVAILPNHAVLVGNTGMIVPSLSVGCVGAVAGMANCVPELIADLWNTYMSGDSKGATAKQHQINDITARFKVGPSIPVYKYILKLRGFNFEYSLPPMREFSEEEKIRIQEVFEEVKPMLH